MIRVLIADDHPVVRVGVKHVLEQQPDFEVVGEAVDGSDAVAKAVELNPDVVILDMEMGDSHGVEALQRMRTARPDIKVVVYTGYENAQLIVDSTALGVQGYVFKDSGANKLVKAVRTVYRGEIYLESKVALKLMHGIHHGPAVQADTLTPRELQVLQRLAQGQRNQAIADSLFMSERTAKYHVSSILNKLGAKNRTEAVTMAYNIGLLSADDSDGSRQTGLRQGANTHNS